jgi:hypothetical protein
MAKKIGANAYLECSARTKQGTWYMLADHFIKFLQNVNAAVLKAFAKSRKIWENVKLFNQISSLSVIVKGSLCGHPSHSTSLLSQLKQYGREQVGFFVNSASFSNTTVAGVREVFEAATRAALAGKSGSRSGGRSGRKRDRLCCLM